MAILDFRKKFYNKLQTRAELGYKPTINLENWSKERLK